MYASLEKSKAALFCTKNPASFGENIIIFKNKSHAIFQVSCVEHEFCLEMDDSAVCPGELDAVRNEPDMQRIVQSQQQERFNTTCPIIHM